MRVLFVHQNFPAQFRHLAPLLAARGDEVVALTFNPTPATPGTRVVRSQGTYTTGAGHPWARDFDTKVIRAEATLATALRLRDEGFTPDVIVAHPAWGESLFLKDVWPSARLGIYCEFFYTAVGGDHDFDPEFALNEPAERSAARIRLKNLPQRLHFDLADAGLSPTCFQADTYPVEMRDRITVTHEGIDTDVVKPGAPLPVRLTSGATLTANDEVITFVSRNLEPYRGFHILTRALPELLRRRPRAKVLIVGHDGTGYGAAAPAGTTWKQHFLGEVAGQFDPARVLFVGMLDYRNFLNILRLSRLHIYLTYPFVLSWSLLEAMATGCAVLASDTAPLREFIMDGETGALVPFFDREALVDRACALLEDDDLRRHLGARARERVVETVDLRTICLPRQLAWIDRLAAATPRIAAPPV